MKLYIQSGYIETDLNLKNTPQGISEHLTRVANKEKEALQNITKAGDKIIKESSKIQDTAIIEIENKSKELIDRINLLQDKVNELSNSIITLEDKEKQAISNFNAKIALLQTSLLSKLSESVTKDIERIKNKAFEDLKIKISELPKIDTSPKQKVEIIKETKTVVKEIPPKTETGREVFVDGTPFKSEKDIESLKHGGNREHLI